MAKMCLSYVGMSVPFIEMRVLVSTGMHGNPPVSSANLTNDLKFYLMEKTTFPVEYRPKSIVLKETE